MNVAQYQQMRHVFPQCCCVVLLCVLCCCSTQRNGSFTSRAGHHSHHHLAMNHFQVICAIVFHCLTALFVWSYAMVIFTPPGFAPLSWHLSPDQVKHWNGPRHDFFHIMIQCPKKIQPVPGGQAAVSPVRGGVEGLALHLGRAT